MSVTLMLGLRDKIKLKRGMKIPDFTKIGDVLEEGKFYRHPDSAEISYPLAVEPEIGVIPDGGDLNIGIVGAGAAGISALYELSRIAAKRSSGNITVTIFETDPNSFLAKPAGKAVDVFGKKAGRVSAARVGESETVYEVGAMRFPTIAGLTWHYAAQVFDEDAPIKIFPNPGTVATEFVFGDQVDRYARDTWHDESSPTLAVKDAVIFGFIGDPGFTPGEPGYLPGEHDSLFMIGDERPYEVLQKLKEEDTPADQLTHISQNWKDFVHQWDGHTLESAVRQCVRFRLDILPEIPGLSSTAEKENYYVELFGRFGFGTGGFKPLYNISLPEIMRLVLWDYSREYSLPVDENVTFIEDLCKLALKTDPGGAKFEVSVVLGRVSDVFHDPRLDSPATVLYYEHKDAEDPAARPLHQKNFDYAILALPQDQLIPMVTRAGYAVHGDRTVKFGDIGLGYATVDYASALPPLLMSRTHAAQNARAVTAVSMLTMVRSSKVFGKILTSDVEGPGVPSFTYQADQDDPSSIVTQKIKAVVSDCGLAASYIVPSSINSLYSTLLVSYTWNDDSTRLQRDFGMYPQNVSEGKALSAEDMFRTMINRASRDIKDPLTGFYTRWWFADVLSKVTLEDRFVFDWTTNQTAGGFKLDVTGDYYQSNFCFRYHTHAKDAALGNRFFLACDSYSHLGGWLEGAFMSAINAVSGIVVAANGGGESGVAQLNLQARKLFTSLDNVVPAPSEQVKYLAEEEEGAA
ncbi:tryptophan 2-monooxygenase oxidoreductase [Collimonas antrihumi]|uniref:tryptophan 2-monooxygenase oxidoreductase n=1 Tax=Collimonas antrihumi TaxID=1940615 RepID=UPI001FE9A732|nr:tryptophan 2-monooxygenase oxidoreductase [Collimonas antrihumi]